MNLVDVIDLPTGKYQACTVNNNTLEIVTESGKLYKSVASCKEEVHLQYVERLFNSKQRCSNHSNSNPHLTFDLCVDLASVIAHDSYSCTKSNSKVLTMCAMKSTLWLATSSGKVYLVDCNSCEIIKNGTSASFSFFYATERPCALTSITTDNKRYVAIRTECGEVFVIDAETRTRITVLSLDRNHVKHTMLSNIFTFDNHSCLYVCDDVSNKIYTCNVKESPVQLVECVMEKSSTFVQERMTSKTDTTWTTTTEKQTSETLHLSKIVSENEKHNWISVDKIIKLVYDDVWMHLYVCFANGKIDVYKVVEPENEKRGYKLEQSYQITLPCTSSIKCINNKQELNCIADITIDATSLYVFTRELNVFVYDLYNHQQRAMLKLSDNWVSNEVFVKNNEYKSGVSKLFVQVKQNMTSQSTLSLECRQVFQLQSREAAQGFITLLNNNNCNNTNSRRNTSLKECCLCYWEVQNINSTKDTISEEGKNCIIEEESVQFDDNNDNNNEQLQNEKLQKGQLRKVRQMCVEQNARVHDAKERKEVTLSILSDKINKEQMELVRLEECNRKQASELQELRLRLMSADNEKQIVLNEVAKYKKELDKLREEINTKCNEANQATLHCASIERDYNRAQTEIAQLQKEITECQALHALCNSNKLEEHNKLEIKEMEKDQLERQLQEMVAKLTSCCNENKRLVSYAFTSRLLSENVNKDEKSINVNSNVNISSKKTNDEPTNSFCNERISNNINQTKEGSNCNEMLTNAYLITENNNADVESLRSCLRSALYTIRRYEEENRDLVQLFNSTASMLAGRVSSERLHALLLATMIRHPMRFELRCSEAEKTKILSENKHFISFLNSLHSIDQKAFDKLMYNLQLILK